jgi:hypothetical protein
MFIKNIGNADMLVCPACGFDYNHLKAVQYRYNNDKYEITREISVTDEGNVNERELKEASKYRGNQICIYVWGECWHNWAIKFNFHKGNVFIHTVVLEKDKSPQYSEYLKSDEWKQITKAKREEAGNKCQLCNNGNFTLHVHHRTYDNIFHESLSDLIVLCENCHAKFHDMAKEIK